MTLSGPSWLSLAAELAGGTVSGSPVEAGRHPFTVTVTDAASATTTYSCDIVATSPPLSIAGACPAGITRPGSISMSVTGSGGMQPYSWGVSGPSWLSITGSGAQATISGTPPGAGSVPFTVTLSDGVKTPQASFSCNVPVAPPQLSVLTIAAEQPRRPLLEAQPVFLQFTSPMPVELTAEYTITFRSDVPGTPDNPEVQFLNTVGAGLGRKLAALIPVNVPSSPPLLVKQGTVAGVIRIELTSLKDGMTELLNGDTQPALEIAVPRQVPVITSLLIENERADGFDVVISGFSTTRQINSVQLNFAARPEARLDGASSATVDVGQLFASFYARPASLANGGAFTGLRIPVNVGGSKAAIGAVEAMLVNSMGSSQISRVAR
jgi:hypothetical protein